MTTLGRFICFSVPSVGLSGCVGGLYAASYAVAAGGTALGAYGMYEVMRDGRLSLDAKTIELTPAGATALGAAKTVAIWPALDGTDGETVDKARPLVSARLVEPSKTTRWVRSQKIALDDYSETERNAKLRQFGRAMGADIVVFTQDVGQEAETGLFSAPKVRLQFLTTAVRVSSGEVVWKEEHVLVQDGIQGINSAR